MNYGVVTVRNASEVEAVIEKAKGINDRRLGQVLVDQGAISKEDLERALEVQKSSPGKKLGEILIDIGALHQYKVSEGLYAKLGIPSVDLSQYSTPAEVAKLLDDALVREHTAVPIALIHGGKTLVVATDNPIDNEKTAALAFATGLMVIPVFAPQTDVLYRADLNQIMLSVEKGIKKEEAKLYPFVPTARLTIDGLLKTAIEQRGLSLVLRQQNGRGKALMKAFDGTLTEVSDLSLDALKSVIGCLKDMCLIDRNAADAPFRRGCATTEVDGKNFDLRVEFVKSLDGDLVSIKIANGTAQRRTIDTLGFSSPVMEKLHHCMSEVERIPEGQGGLILVSSTRYRSGVTTTAYAIMRALTAKGEYAISIEDVIKERLPGVVQIRAPGNKVSVLQNAIEQKPRVLLIDDFGHDEDLFHMAVDAANAGIIVVFTYGGSETVAGSIGHLLTAPAVDAEELSRCLKFIVNQILVGAPCEHCQVGRRAPEYMEYRGMIPTRVGSCEFCGVRHPLTPVVEVIKNDERLTQHLIEISNEDPEGSVEEYWEAVRDGLHDVIYFNNQDSIEADFLRLVEEGRIAPAFKDFIVV